MNLTASTRPKPLFSDIWLIIINTENTLP
jgi:hypothetical protein